MESSFELRISLCLLICASAALLACDRTMREDEKYEWSLPATFDSLPPVPDDNAMNSKRVKLGERLFFDQRISADGNISCASCHKPALAYADTVAISGGVHGRKDFRNSPSLLNVAYQLLLFREGGIPSLELQALAPFINESEMDLNMLDVHTLLSSDAAYQQLSTEAYGEALSPLIAAKALACFQRSLTSQGSAFDALLTGDSADISASARRGYRLFYSDKTSCSSCHAGFLLTDQNFYNTGLYQVYVDEGRGRLTLREEDMGKMKTPSLRNVALTRPYMHNGAFDNIDQVLQHYNMGGKGHPNQDSRIRPLGLNDAEIDDLKAFLEILTDTVFQQRQEVKSRY